MDANQTREEQNRQFQHLMAHSTPEEQRKIIEARNDHRLRKAVELLGGPYGNR